MTVTGREVRIVFVKGDGCGMRWRREVGDAACTASIELDQPVVDVYLGKYSGSARVSAPVRFKG